MTITVTRFLTGATALFAFVGMVTALHIAAHQPTGVCITAAAPLPAWAGLLWPPLLKVNPPGTVPGTEVAVRRTWR